MTRTLRDALEAAAAYSPADERLNRRRRTAGLVLGPVAFAALLAFPMPSVPGPAHRLAAVFGLVAVFWITEAVPMAVAALLGPILAILLRISPAQSALAPFADPIIFLFIGSFMLAEAMFVHGLDRRIALTALASPLVGARAGRIFVVYGAVVTGISMWVSNTATTAMMFPVALSIVTHLAAAPVDTTGLRRFALAMMLVTSFGASVGGLATPVGTPPNLIGIGLLERVGGVPVTFFGWMTVGLPAALLLFVFLAAYFITGGFTGLDIAPDGVAIVRRDLDRLGPLSAGERNVALTMLLTVALWVTPGVLALAHLGHTELARSYGEMLPEGVAAMVGALLLFVLPVNWRQRRFTLTWAEAVRIDWGVVLLYGGGLALGELAFTTGLAENIGKATLAILPTHSRFSLTVIFTLSAILLSEVASNTASAALIVPVAIAVSKVAGVAPLEPALGATLGASMGFIMPVSTPANAIVYSSGYVPIASMMRHGLALDAAGFVVIVASVTTLGRLV